MGRSSLLPIFPWSQYSAKATACIVRPRWAGFFTPEEAAERKMRLAIGEEGRLGMGHMIRFYWLVDEADGILTDVKYQLFGQSALIAAAEGAAELLCGKNYDQAQRIGADLIDKQLRDTPRSPALPIETSGHFNLVLGAIEAAAQTCSDLPLPDTYSLPTPLLSMEGEGHPDYPTMSKKERLALIEGVIAEQIRPYAELDAGGIEIIDLAEGDKLHIAYQGSCTSCYAATGSTLTTIQGLLRALVSPTIAVIPNLDQLTFSS